MKAASSVKGTEPAVAFIKNLKLGGGFLPASGVLEQLEFSYFEWNHIFHHFWPACQIWCSLEDVQGGKMGFEPV